MEKHKRHKRHKIVFILLAIVFSFQSVYGQNTNLERKRWKRFQVEIFGGLTFVDPADLNLRPEYDRQYLEDQRNYYKYYYPSAQQGFPSGDFEKLQSVIPFGLGLRYRLSRFFSLSLGFKYFSRNQASQVTARFTALGSRPYDLDFEYSPYSISASGYSPYLGVYFSFRSSRRVNFEVFLSGGPLFAKCRYQVWTRRFYSRNNRVYRANETFLELLGKSTGLSLSTGARINARVMGPIQVFCEGGYSFQSTKNLNGEGSFTYYVYTGPNTKEVSDQLNWEGYWGVKESQGFAPLPSNEWEKNDPRVGEFTLDLSGVFLQFGLSFSFSL
jgi:hypothetical protein